MKLTVPSTAPARLDAFLAQALRGASKDDIRRWLETGRVKVNGKKAKPLRRLFGGEIVELDLPAASAPKQDTQGPTLSVLYENTDLAIIDKPAGLVVDSDGPRPSVVKLAASQLSHLSIAGQHQPGVAHRLDKDTTGCLALAKTDLGLKTLLEAFEQGRVTKTYLALVHGRPPPTGTLDSPYQRHPTDPRRFTSLHHTTGNRRARLSWTTERELDTITALRIELDTGRTHQIRVQLADLGFPLLGDWLYGTTAEPSIGRIALHAWKLTLQTEHRPIEVEAPIPDDFRRGMSGRS